MLEGCLYGVPALILAILTAHAVIKITMLVKANLLREMFKAMEYKHKTQISIILHIKTSPIFHTISHKIFL